MDLKETKGKTKNVNDEILELIDYKTNTDMEKLITEIKTLEKIMVSQMANQEKVMANQMANQEKSISNQIRTLYWVMGIALAAIGVLIAVR